MTSPNFSLYYEAIRADQLFNDALEEVHGSRRAGDMRYQPDSDTPAIANARGAYHAASKAWLDEMQRHREQRMP